MYCHICTESRNQFPVVLIFSVWEGTDFPCVHFPTVHVCKCVCVCVCLQIVTTLMAAPAREHQMSLHLPSAISHSVHLSLQPSIAPSLHDPPVSVSPRRLEPLHPNGHTCRDEKIRRGGRGEEGERGKRKSRARCGETRWAVKDSRVKKNTQQKPGWERRKGEEMKGRIGGGMKRETIKALHTHIDTVWRPAVCESVEVTSEWSLRGAKEQQHWKTKRRKERKRVKKENVSEFPSACLFVMHILNVHICIYLKK